MSWGLVKKRKITHLITSFIALCVLTACGDATSLNLDATLTIGMMGVFEAPPGAPGNAEPRSITFTLTSLTAVDSEGNSTALFEDDPTEFTIVSRPQVLLKKNMKDFVGKTFTDVTATFNARVIAVAKTPGGQYLTLRQPTVRFSDGLEIAKGKSKRLDIHVQWKDTVVVDANNDSETITQPSLAFVAK